jgi:hypothetical protein
MAEGSDELERLSREQLILKARVLGVERAELMTRVELRDEIVRRSEPDPVQQKRARGFLGVARDLVASVVEAGLNLPDAAKLIRGEGSREGDWKGPPPVATVTLAEIYASQGHVDRALHMLDEVLSKEPDHDPARALRDRLAAGELAPAAAAPRKRTKISFVEPPPESSEPDPDTDLEPEIAAAPAAESAPEVAPAPVSVPEVAPAPVSVPEVVAAPAAVPAPEIPAVPAPERAPYLVTLSVSGHRQVYWEIPDHTWDPLRARSPQGRAVLRVVSFRTRANQVERRSLDIPPHAEIGSAVLPGLSADAIVRAAIGWSVDGHFTPFVLASDLGAVSPTRSAEHAAQFRPHPLVGAVSPDAERRALEHLARSV